MKNQKSNLKDFGSFFFKFLKNNFKKKKTYLIKLFFSKLNNKFRPFIQLKKINKIFSLKKIPNFSKKKLKKPKRIRKKFSFFFNSTFSLKKNFHCSKKIKGLFSLKK
jgi:hypothetical protein